jgi:hypothetical protein
MIKVIVKNLSNVEKYSGRFATLSLAQAWVAGKVTAGTFGAVDTYTVTYTDISGEVALVNATTLRRKKREFGERMVDRISAVNESKSLDLAAIDAFMTNPAMALMREHLYAGNIPTFIDKLSTLDVSAFFTNAEKQAVLDECLAFMGTLT